MENNDLISRNDAINAVSSLMPSLTTPDGTGSNDNEIISAQEMCADALQALHKVPTVYAAPVPCRECKDWGMDAEGHPRFCKIFERVTSGQFYCAYGRRKEANQ